MQVGDREVGHPVQKYLFDPVTRVASFVANYYAMTGYSRSDDWFTKAARRTDFRDRPYLDIARYTNYIKLKKIVKLVDEVEDYVRVGGLQRSQVKVLDVGCGIGIYALCLASLGYQVIGVDINGSDIKTAKERAEGFGNVDFIVAEGATYLENSDALFSVILALDVLEHMEQPEGFCRAVMDRILAPGVFLIIVPDGYGEVELLYVTLSKLLRNRFLHQAGATGGEHIQRFTLGRIQTLLVQSGFEYRFVSSVFTTRLPFLAAFLGGFRGLPAYWNTKAADSLPSFMTNSWVVSGIKR